MKQHHRSALHVKLERVAVRCFTLLVLLKCGAFLLHGWPLRGCFAQMGMRRFREKEGSQIRVPVSGTNAVKMDGLTSGEAKLMTQLAEAAKGRNWVHIQALWSSYSGSAFPVFCAAMQAAFQCGKYVAAAEIYEALRRSSAELTSTVPLTMGIKIFGKLGQHQKVKDIWEEAQTGGLVDQFVAGTFIDAGAEAGDFMASVEGLDYMLQHGYDVDASRFCSVINACKNSDLPDRHKAARFLFQQMLDKGLHPDVATFAALVGAYQEAPLKIILGVRATMQELGTIPNIVFAEVYISALLGRLEGNADEVAALLQKVTKPRREAALTALQDFRASGVQLSYLCKKVEKALSRYRHV
ncbi:unnamed protein product [Symbiodinium sp. CCMP2456]|nr:unnamed protein product [Symbiodinium sp. CCMP2456]